MNHGVRKQISHSIFRSSNIQKKKMPKRNTLFFFFLVLHAVPWHLIIYAITYNTSNIWTYAFKCLPDPGIEPGSPALQLDSLPNEPSGNPFKCLCEYYIYIYAYLKYAILIIICFKKNKFLYSSFTQNNIFQK